MAEVLFSELEPEVRSAGPRVPVPTIIRELRRSFINLCRRSLCYRVDIDDDTVAASTAEIALTVPANTVMVRPIKLTIAERPFTAASAALAAADDQAWHDREASYPEFYWPSYTAVSSIRVYPMAATTLTGAGQGISGTIAVQPSRTSTGIEEIMLERYQDAAIDDVLGRLLTIKDTDWYDPNQAGFHLAMFEQRVLDAKADAENEAAPDKPRTTQYGGL